MKLPMLATKAMTYGTRRLKAGDAFEANRQDARVLSAIGKADYSTRMLVAEPQPAAQRQAAPAPKVDAPDDIAALRAAYHEKIGKRPFHGWDAETLRAKMAEAE